MTHDLYSHPLIKPLLANTTETPIDAINQLTKEIAKDKTLSKKCNKLLRHEVDPKNDKPDSCLPIWIAFSLARANDEEAITTLFDFFEFVDPLEHDMLWELAQFALWQYGDRVVRRALNDFTRIAEVDHTGYFLGVLEVVGLSRDQLLRRRVADKAIEAMLSPITSPASLMGLVDLALILKDKRLSSILDEWKKRLSPKERGILEESEGLLFKDDPSMRNDEFLLPWTDLAGFSAEHFSIHLEGVGATQFALKDMDKLIEDFRELAQSFRQSPRFLDIPAKWRKKPDQVVTTLTDIFVILFESLGAIPEDADAEEISELMVEHIPRKMVCNRETFRSIPSTLEAFFRFITDSYSKEEGNEIASFIHASSEEMLTNAEDPTYWDGAKALGMKKLK